MQAQQQKERIFLPTTHRGLSLVNAMAGSTTETMKPRVGEKVAGTPWTGGSNLKKNEETVNVVCFCLEGSKEVQKQHESLKQGLGQEQQLELHDELATTIVKYFQCCLQICQCQMK